MKKEVAWYCLWLQSIELRLMHGHLQDLGDFLREYTSQLSSRLRRLHEVFVRKARRRPADDTLQERTDLTQKLGNVHRT